MSTTDKVYGSRKYTFTTSGQKLGKRDKIKYFTLVNEKQKTMLVYDKGLTNLNDRLVGSYDLTKKPPKFKKNETSLFISDPSEVKYFQSPEGTKLTQNAAIQGGVKEQVKDAGVNPAVARKQMKDIVNTGSTNVDPNDIDDVRQAITEAAIDVEEAKRPLGRSSFPEDLQYPISMDEEQDKIKFTVLDFAPRRFDSETPGVLEARNRNDQQKISKGSVILPIPAGIKDQNSVDWISGNLNPLEALGAQVTLAELSKQINQGDENAGDLGKIISGVTETLGSTDIKKSASALLGGAATGTGQQILQRTTGQIINPNAELLFNGPQLRQFNFLFNLSARTKKEGEEVRRIIRLFKQAMAPRRTVKGIFLKNPFVFQLKYIGNDVGLNKFKECALVNCATDYTPNGPYSTYEDGTMTQYKLGLQFSELDPVFNDDYPDDFNSIGF